MCSNQEFTTVEPYSSGSESESDESTNEQPGGPEEPNHRRQNLVWLFTQQFETADIALDWIVEQKIWTKRREYATDAGDKVFYRCNRVKRRSRRQCAHAVLLQYNSGDDAVNLFETPEEHDHDQINITSTRQGIKSFPNVSLLADAADAITNGFKATFYPNTSSFKRGMCWFHMQKAVSNRLCILDENQLEKLILIDINALQLTSSNRLFEAAVKLFVEKWKRHINVNINSFLEYFQDEWVDHHCGWYEGYLPDGPSTNNGLEGTNGTIKTEHTFRKRVSLATFLLKANEIVETWSNKRDSASANNPKLVVTEPIKKLKCIFILSTKRVILWYHF